MWGVHSVRGVCVCGVEYICMVRLQCVFCDVCYIELQLKRFHALFPCSLPAQHFSFL